jgi:hypothetical protein
MLIFNKQPSYFSLIISKKAKITILFLWKIPKITILFWVLVFSFMDLVSVYPMNRTFVYLLKNSSSQFLVTGNQLSQCLAVRNSVVFLKKPKQKHDSHFLGGKIQICCIVSFFMKPFFHWTTSLLVKRRSSPKK